MGLSFSQSLLNLAPHGQHLAAFSFQKPQAVPQPDDFAFSADVHAALEQKENNLTSRYG
jgi:hypothetical protein